MSSGAILPYGIMSHSKGEKEGSVCYISGFEQTTRIFPMHGKMLDKEIDACYPVKGGSQTTEK